MRFTATHQTLSPGRSTVLQARAAAGAQAEPPDRCESSRAVLTVKQNACCFTSTLPEVAKVSAVFSHEETGCESPNRAELVQMQSCG